jgi:hypothetical protein
MKGYAFGALVVMLALVLVGPSASGAITASAAFNINFQTSAILGGNIQGNISGPSGDEIGIGLFGQPFNDSSPVFATTFHLTNKTTNLSIPTNLLTLGAYELRINTTSISSTPTLLYISIVYILDPINATQVNNELYQLQQEIAALSREVGGLSNQVSTFQFDVNVLFWVFFALFAFLLLYDQFKRFLARRPYIWRSARKGWKNFWFTAPIRKFSPDIEPERVITPGVNVERKYRSRYCDDCSTLRTLDEMTFHLSSVHGRLEPVDGKDYWVDESQQAYIQEKGTPPVETGKHRHGLNLKVDLTGLV